MGVPSGRIFAAVTRALFTARARLFQSLDWGRASRLLRWFHPAPPPLKVSDEKSPNGLEAVVNEKMFDREYGLVPAQPDDKSRVWGVNSIAQSSSFGGTASEAAPQHSGYRLPQSVKRDKSAQPGAFPATSDYFASLTVPGVQMVQTAPGSKRPPSPVEVNSVASGKLFTLGPAGCSVDPGATEELAPNTPEYLLSRKLDEVFKRSSPGFAREGRG